MSEKKITKLDFEELQKYKRSDNEFYIQGIEIWEIDSELWNQEITLKFWQCEFKEQIIFPSRKRARVKARIAFQDCIFEKFVNARSSLFQKDFECHSCIFEQSVSFSSAKFNGKVDFRITKFKNEARFIETQFLVESTDDQMIQSAFREAQFEGRAIFSGAIFRGKVNFGITKFKNEARFIETQFQGDESIFREAQFEGNASFDGATFRGRVNFEVTKFKNEARFIKVQFKGDESTFRETQFEGKVDFDNTIFNGKVNFGITKFKNEASFIKVQFKGDESTFRETQFEGGAIFSGAIFRGKVNFGIAKFKNKARFIGTQFQGDESIFREAQFEGRVTFGRAIFRGKVDFRITRFKDEARFIGTQFQGDESIFRGAQFEGDTIFGRTTFDGKVDFSRTKFLGKTLWRKITPDENVNFQGSVFGGVTSFEDSKIELIDFLNCTFSNQFNIDHQYLKLDYQELKNKIEQTSKEKDENAQGQESGTSHESGKNDQSIIWRDLFRKLKSNRLAYHNLIDASELRTQELYAREIELDSKNLSIFSKDWIEKWQLWFYRHTSDHHTDLMKIFNNVIMLIALFGIFSWGITHFKMEHHSYEKQYVGSVMNSAVVLDIRKKSYSLTESDFKKEKQDLQSLSLKQNDFSETHSIAFFCFLFMVLFIGAVSIDCLKNNLVIGIRNILSYFVVLGVLILKPALLFPLVGQIFDDGLKVNFPVMQSLSVLYCILMFLMLFSLQKTARKNSIVPS